MNYNPEGKTVVKADGQCLRRALLRILPSLTWGWNERFVSVTAYLKVGWRNWRCSFSSSLSLSRFPYFHCVAELPAWSAAGTWKRSHQFRVCPSTFPSGQTSPDARGSQSTFPQARPSFPPTASCCCVRTTWMFPSTRLWPSTPSHAKYVTFATAYFSVMNGNAFVT